MRKTFFIIALIGLFLVSGCQEEQDNNAPENNSECNSDSDCIPLPSDCHPMQCINKKYESEYEKPEFCTKIFMFEAAYNPEDCLCVDNICANKNIGRTPEDENDEEQDCIKAGGEWKTFPNTCVDSCEYRRNDDLMCGMALTEGCDCGEGMCWNGESCEQI
jgi:hypothetical protein